MKKVQKLFIWLHFFISQKPDICKGVCRLFISSVPYGPFFIITVLSFLFGIQTQNLDL